jgi:hypothetical protein
VFQIDVPKPLRAPVVVTVAAALLGCVLPASSIAAAPPPESTATCYASMSPTPTADEPNLLDYRFHCDTRITAYTILANRGVNDFATIDDFSPTASIFEPDGTTPDTTTTWTCEGYLPGTSTNCNTGSQTAHMNAWSWADGTIDTTDPYCKNLPEGAKPGTPAKPRALVQLVVTDVSGAQDGPFRVYYTKTCPAVPDRAPFPAKPSKKHKKHSTTKPKGSK